jgi:glutamyl-tRNA synthetase
MTSVAAGYHANRMDVTRLAPSPTGALHLGNARTFLVNWCMARQFGWRMVLRIEDLDGPRVKRGADQAALDDLAWLGLDWDAGPVRQSGRAAAYQAAADWLVAAGHAYPCVCTRREVELAASAPHAEDGSAVYPGTCRGRFPTVAAARAAAGRAPAVRFRVPDDAAAAVVAWPDAFRGPQRVDARALGDFVIAKADGTAAYQLAVVVDDADAGVTQVVRGDDLVDSTPRQVLLYRARGMADRVPTYCHLPLVTGPDGRRLAKRHGDTRLDAYRAAGVERGRVLALLARWCGVADAGTHITPQELIARVQLTNLPREPVTFSADDDAWLRRG